MTEVQYRSRTAVIRITGNNSCFNAGCPRDDLCPATGFTRLIELLEIFEKGGIAD